MLKTLNTNKFTTLKSEKLTAPGVGATGSRQGQNLALTGLHMTCSWAGLNCENSLNPEPWTLNPEP